MRVESFWLRINVGGYAPLVRLFFVRVVLLVCVDLRFGVCSSVNSCFCVDLIEHEVNTFSLFNRYDLKLNNAILAEEKHKPM